MGRQEVYLEAAALGAVADCFDDTAAAIASETRIRLGGLAFDGAAAGRDHVAAGEALRHALDAWARELTCWARAGTEIAAALRAGLAQYGRAELFAADRVG